MIKLLEAIERIRHDFQGEGFFRVKTREKIGNLNEVCGSMLSIRFMFLVE